MNIIYEQLENEIKSVKFVKGLRRNVNNERYYYIHFGKIFRRYKGIMECSANKKHPEFYKLLKDLIKLHDPDFKFTSIIINKNNVCKKHKDKNNIFKSYIFGLGDYEGGETIIDGKKFNIKHNLVKFDGMKKEHYSLEFTKTRYSIVYFTNKFLNMKIETIKNFKFIIRKRTTDIKVIKEVIEENCYIKRGFTLNKNQVWLDLGGNIGTFAIKISSQVSKIITFEPEKENICLLRKNLKLNNIKNVMVREFAVTNKGTEDKLFLCNTHYNKYQHSTIQKTYKNHIPIRSLEFRKILTKRINCIKMDIEGSEIEILENVEDWKNVYQLVFEWSFKYDNDIDRLRNVIKKLRKTFPNINYNSKKQINDLNLKIWKNFPTGLLVWCKK